MKWDESKHPRDNHGRFTNGFGEIIVGQGKVSEEFENLLSQSIRVDSLYSEDKSVPVTIITDEAIASIVSLKI